MKRPTRSRGSSLLLLLLVTVLVLGLALVLSSLGTSHLRFSARVGSGERALNAAESVLALAIEKVRTDPEFGQTMGPGYGEILEVRLQESVGRLVFSRELSVQENLPFSTNNLSGDQSVQGWSDASVPARSVYLVAEGTNGGARRQVGAVLHLPPYPFVIASSGPVVAPKGLLVGSVGDEIPKNNRDLDPDQLLPGELGTNSTGAQAVLLGPDSLITGSVSAGGGVVLDPTAVVLGSLKTEPVDIPAIELEDYDPRILGGGYQTLPAYLQGPPLTGRSLAQGNLEVLQDLKLDEGLLFVEGDLTVYGGIRGSGIVVVTGDLEVRQGCQLTASNQAALLVAGDVSLKGLGPSRSAFQGLVYTEGDFLAEEISLVGTFIANSPKTGGSTLQLENAHAIHAPKVAKVTTAPAKTIAIEDRAQGFLDSLGPPDSYNPANGQTRWNIPISGPGVSIESGSAWQDTHAPGAAVDFGLFLTDNGDGTGTLLIRDDNYEFCGQSPPIPADPAVPVDTLLNHPAWQEHWRSEFEQLLTSAGFSGKPPNGSARSTAQAEVVGVDLDTFLKTKDRFRVLMWREL